MSTSIITLMVLIPVLFALLYIVRRSIASKAPTLGHHLLASGSVLSQIRRD
jgi:hypothetical protein